MKKENLWKAQFEGSQQGNSRLNGNNVLEEMIIGDFPFRKLLMMDK